MSSVDNAKYNPGIEDMKTDSHDSLAVAIKMMQRAGTDAGTESDMGDLFLAELQARRKRLEHWLRLLNAQARLRPPADRQAQKRRTAAHG
jgi:hypothetical protein